MSHWINNRAKQARVNQRATPRHSGQNPELTPGQVDLMARIRSNLVGMLAEEDATDLAVLLLMDNMSQFFYQLFHLVCETKEANAAGQAEGVRRIRRRV